MPTLAPAERRQLRARAHALKPVVFVGQHGLTPAVLHEIDVALLAHELVKIRVSGDDRAERDALLDRICAEVDAAPVQHLGKVLTVWRVAPKPEKTDPAPPRKRASRGPPPSPGIVIREERKRAPSTSKGPFEPGRRTARPAAGTERRRRRQP